MAKKGMEKTRKHETVHGILTVDPLWNATVNLQYTNAEKPKFQKMKITNIFFAPMETLGEIIWKYSN